MNRYPPLKSLVFLDAAMRARSFSLAAAELCVTPGAVGQQIHKLETWLGQPLFVRQVRQVVPTAEGLAYWQRIQPALAQIADASRKLRDGRSAVVWISMPPTFAAKWFPSRMARLMTRHPEIQLRLSASAALVDFEQEPIDLAIRYFDGQASDLEVTPLFADAVRVYASSACVASLGLQQPDDLQRATLLDITVMSHWEAWLAHFSQLGKAQVGALPRVHFDLGLMAIEAARQGQGVVLTSPLLVENEVAEGSLIDPFGCSLELNSGYYIVHPARLPLRPAAAAVKAWFIGEGAGRSIRQP